MPIALNLTAPLKQDAESQAAISALIAGFAEDIQPGMDAALADSELVHFARVLVLNDRDLRLPTASPDGPPRHICLQVLTEFDGDPIAYTEFFRLELGHIFKQVFALVEGAPPWDAINNKLSFFEYAQSLNPSALGETVRPDVNRGYLFAAYGDQTVEDVNYALERAAAP